MYVFSWFNNHKKNLHVLQLTSRVIKILLKNNKKVFDKIL